MNAQMRWNDVQFFSEVARTGSLSGAARTLGVNHSTVFRRIGALESDLRVKLFDRDGGRYALTEAGQAALVHAIKAESALSAFRLSVEDHEAEAAGRVRLTAPEALLPLLAPLLAPFREAYPRIDLAVDFADRFFDLGKEADVALRPTPRPAEGVAGRRVCGVAWTAYRPSGAPADLPWARYGGELAELGASRWRRRVHPMDPVALGVNSVPAMSAVICAAGCRGMLPCFVGDPDPAVERVCAPIEEAGSALWLLVHPDNRRSARIRALLDHLWEALRPSAPLLEGLL